MGIFKQFLSLIISFNLIVNQCLYAVDLPLEVDQSAAAQYKPTLDTAPNGVQIVNIVNPNATGMSHNKFKEYNVNPKGLILNNSKQVVNTQLAGYISYNPNLANNATMILNEVTGTNKSLLKGYSEVAGVKADVIVANPNGITINGGGFINTNRAILTTGTPSYLNGFVNGFNVNMGQILIEGNGFNTNNINKVELYAKALQLNAKFYANDIKATMGDNFVDLDGNAIFNETLGSGISIDSSLLGGIYANRIELLSSDKGVGVNLPPEVYAQDSLNLTADGKLFFNKTKSNTLIANSITDSIEINQDVYSNTIQLNANSDILINNTGALNAKSSIDLKSNTLANNGIIFSGLNEDNTVNTIGSLKIENYALLNSAQINASQDIDIITQELTNEGLIHSGNDLTITSENLLNNKTIFSAYDMYLYTDNILTNNKDANIIAMNDMTLASDSLNNKTTLIENKSATIRTFNGNLNIYTKNLNNIAEDIVIEENTTDAYDSFQYFAYFYDATQQRGIAKYCGPASRWCGTHSADYYQGSFKDTIQTVSEYTPANILSGNNIYFNIEDTLKNKYSLIQANNDISITTDTLINQSKDLKKVITETYYIITNAHGSGYVMGWNTLNKEVVIDSIPSTIEAGNTVTGNIDTVNNGAINQNIVIPVVNENPQEEIKIEVPDDDYGVFVKAKNTASKYLIETNPLFSNYGNFISSDYFFDKIGFSLDNDIKILGDSFYEITLVTNSIYKQIGRRFIDKDITDESAQYKNLMDNAIQAQNDLNLVPGVALTKDQINALKQDIVWMEEREVEGERVLVPIVYFSDLNNMRLSNSEIIANNDINLNVNILTNSGTLSAGNNLMVNSTDTIQNYGGLINAEETIDLQATSNIKNTSGEIKSKDITLQSKNIVNELFSKEISTETDYYKESKTITGPLASIEAKADLNIIAEEDFRNIGSKLKAENINVEAENINILTLEKNRDFVGGDGFITGDYSQAYTKEKNIENIGSNLTATNTINLTSKEKTHIQGSNLTTDGNINITGNEVGITAVNDLNYQEQQFHSKGFLSEKTEQHIVYKENVVSSNLNAKNILISSDGDVNLEAAKLKAQENIVIDAKNDINVIAKQYKEGELHFTKKSSWGGLSQSASMNRTDALKAKEAHLQTEALNVILKSGNDIKILGSNIEAASDVQLQATNDVLVSAIQELYQHEQWTEKSSFNIGSLVTSIASLGLFDLGPVYEMDYKLNGESSTLAKASNIKSGNDINIDAGSAKVVGSNLDASNNINAQTDIGSIEILAAQEERNTYSQDKKIEVSIGNIGDFAKSALEMTKTLNGLNGTDDTKLKLSIAKATYDDVQNNEQNTTNRGSNIVSQNGNIALDSTENINIEGSNIQANNGDIELTAEQNINIKEAVDTVQSASKETHAKAEINATIQNEYVEAAKAYVTVTEAAKQLKETKQQYKEFKNTISKLENDLNTLTQEFKNNAPGINKEDLDELSELINDIKGDEKYYLAAIAAATVNLVSQTTIAIQQTQAAISSSYTLGFSGGISLDVTGNKTTSNATATNAVASNLNANNITIKTRNDLNNQTNINGSNVTAKDDLVIDTNELNITASTDTSNQSSKQKDISGSVSMTMYGAASGPQVSLGYGENDTESSSTTQNNSQINATNISTTTSADTNIKGANVNATELLNMVVGGDLNIESLKNTYDTYQKGFNLSAGFSLGANADNLGANKLEQGTINQTIGARTGNGEIASVSGSFGASNGRTKVKETVLTSVTGNQVDVEVGNNTNLKGSMLAAGTYDENGNFIDNGNLNLTTDTLTYQNSTNRVYDSSNSLNLAANIALGDPSKDNKSSTQEDSNNLKVNTGSLEYVNSKTYSKSKTLATLGQGNVTIQDQENSDDLSALNRDTTKVEKDLYSADTGVNVDMTLDGRLLTKNGQKQIVNDFQDVVNHIDDFSRFVKDKIGDYKLTEEQKNKIEKDGIKESFLASLRQNNISEEQIIQILSNSSIQNILGIKSESSELSEIAITITPDKMTQNKILLVDTLVNGAEAINKLVNIVGENNAAASILILQFAIEGPIKTATNIIGDQFKDLLFKDVKDNLSQYIANDLLDANHESWNSQQKEVLNSLADGTSEFSIDLFLSGGIFATIKSAKELGIKNVSYDTMLYSKNFEDLISSNNIIQTPEIKVKTTEIVNAYDTAKTNNWVDSNGKWIYPDNNKDLDAIPGTLKDTTLEKGDILVRYVRKDSLKNYQGNTYNLRQDTKGMYTTKLGQSWEGLSLPGKKEDYVAYKIELLEDLPTKESLITPWFDQMGGGVQYRFDISLSKLANVNLQDEMKPKIKLIGELN